MGQSANQNLNQFYGASDWLSTHLDEAPQSLIDFLSGDGIDIQGWNVLDVGTGDGLIAKSFGHKSNSNVTGVDIYEIDRKFLADSTIGMCGNKCNHTFDFKQISDGEGYGFDSYFDLVISWSAAEHIKDFKFTCQEIFRSLKPQGLFLIQTYPLWNSQWGHHLFDWLPRFFHLTHSTEQIIDYLSSLEHVEIAKILRSGEKTKSLQEILFDCEISKELWLKQCIEVLNSCNKITLEEIQNSIEDSGFVISKVKLFTQSLHMPEVKTKLVDSAIDGVMLLAFKP